MGSLRPLVTRLFGFGVLPIISAVAPLALLPVVARVGGPENWAAYMIALSVGNVAATVIGFGSLVGGAAEVGMLNTEAEKAQLYFQSVKARMVLVPPTLITGAGVSLALTPIDAWGTSLTTFAAAAYAGMNISWWAVGSGQPQVLARYEVLPRVAATIASLALILLWQALWAYGALLLLTMLLGRGAFSRSLVRRFGRPSRMSFRQRIGELKRRLHYLSIDAVNSAYNSLLLPFASFGLPILSTAILASSDRFYRYTLIPLSALGDAFQAWTHEAPGVASSRKRFALIVHIAVAAGGFVAIGLFGPWASGVLFGAQVAATTPISWCYGATFALTGVLAAVGRFYLIPSGRTRLLAIATAAGCIAGVIVMIFGTAMSSDVMLALGLVVSHAIVLAGAVRALFRLSVGYPSIAADGRRVRGTITPRKP